MLRTILSAIVGPVMVKSIEKWGWKFPLFFLLGLAVIGALVWIAILYHNSEIKRCNTEFEHKILQKEHEELQKKHKNLRHLYHQKHSKNDTKKTKRTTSWLPYQSPYAAFRNQFAPFGAFADPRAVLRSRMVLFNCE